MDLIEKAKGFLLEPSRAFESSKYDPLQEALKYYAVIAAIYSIFSSIILVIISSVINITLGKYGIQLSSGIADLISYFVMTFILMIIGAFLWGGILHVFAYILGGRKEFAQTIKAVMYASTPIVLLGWIPAIGFIGWIWQFVLQIIGMQQYQEITTGKAIATVLLPVIIILLVVIIVSIILLTMIIPLIIGSGISG